MESEPAVSPAETDCPPAKAPLKARRSLRQAGIALRRVGFIGWLFVVILVGSLFSLFLSGQPIVKGSRVLVVLLWAALLVPGSYYVRRAGIQLVYYVESDCVEYYNLRESVVALYHAGVVGTILAAISFL